MFVQLLVKERNVLLDEILCQYPSVIKATYFVNLSSPGDMKSFRLLSFFLYLSYFPIVFLVLGTFMTLSIHVLQQKSTFFLET